MADKTTKERLASIETDIGNIKEDIRDIKESTKDIPHMRTVTGFFSGIISAVVAGFVAWMIKGKSY